MHPPGKKKKNHPKQFLYFGIKLIYIRVDLYINNKKRSKGVHHRELLWRDELPLAYCNGLEGWLRNGRLWVGWRSLKTGQCCDHRKEAFVCLRVRGGVFGIQQYIVRTKIYSKFMRHNKPPGSLMALRRIF